MSAAASDDEAQIEGGREDQVLLASVESVSLLGVHDGVLDDDLLDDLLGATDELGTEEDG